MLKRMFDYSLALFGMFISLPLWIIFGWVIWLGDKGEIFYIQDRVGKYSKIFKSIKFRSMIPDAEKRLGPVQAQEEDPRITKIGGWLRHTAMDELPQLINIIKGDMSFVGPRALRPEEKEVKDNSRKSIFEYPELKERSKVRPGLTGVAQVFAPRDIARQSKFRYDIWYIKNQSFLLDIYIIILSFLISFRRKWESRNDKFRFLAKGLRQRIGSQIGYFH